jgi:hypothetical protein
LFSFATKLTAFETNPNIFRERKDTHLYPTNINTEIRLGPFSLSLSLSPNAVTSHQSSLQRKGEYVYVQKREDKGEGFCSTRERERERAKHKPTTNGRIWVNDV